MMLRFIIERHEMVYDAGLDRRDFYTIDLEIPELEAAIKRGGQGPGGFESHRLLGAELRGEKGEA